MTVELMRLRGVVVEDEPGGLELLRQAGWHDQAGETPFDPDSQRDYMMK